MKKVFFLVTLLFILGSVAIASKIQNVFAQTQQSTTGSISGVVFYDKNENGIRDNGEGQTFDNGEPISGVIKLNGFGNYPIRPDGTFLISGLSFAGGTEKAPQEYQAEIVPNFDDKGQVTFIPTTMSDEYVKLPPSAPNPTISFGVTLGTKTVPAGTCQIKANPEHRKFPRNGDNLRVLIRSNPLPGQTVSSVEESTYNFNTIPGLIKSTMINVVWTDFVVPPGGYGTFNLSGTGSIACVVKENNVVKYSQKINLKATLVSWQALTSPIISWTVDQTPVITSTYTEVTPTPSGSTPNCSLQSKGDTNCDGKIDLLDFNIWRDNFLQTNQ